MGSVLIIEENRRTLKEQFHCAWQKVQNILGRGQSDVRKKIIKASSTKSEEHNYNEMNESQTFKCQKDNSIWKKANKLFLSL